MAPLTNKPRLALITSATIYKEFSSIRLPVVGDLARNLRALIDFGREGKGSTRDIDTAVRDVWLDLYCSPYRRSEWPVEEALDPETEVGTVLLAALARRDMRAGRDLSRKSFACLVGVGAKQLSQLSSHGSLKMDDGVITAKDAMRLLAERAKRDEA